MRPISLTAWSLILICHLCGLSNLLYPSICNQKPLYPWSGSEVQTWLSTPSSIFVILIQATPNLLKSAGHYPACFFWQQLSVEYPASKPGLTYLLITSTITHFLQRTLFCGRGRDRTCNTSTDANMLYTVVHQQLYCCFLSNLRWAGVFTNSTIQPFLISSAKIIQPINYCQAFR